MIYYEILPLEQKNIYEKLAFARDKGFILFGGTAIALQLGHRNSVDFDFFASNKLDEKLKKEILTNIGADTILQDEKDTLVYLKNGVKLSFFGSINFATKENSFILDDVLEVANLESLLATKLKVTFDRAEYKDYKDIAEIFKTKKLTLEYGIRQMVNFYGDGFAPSQILKNLTYFSDGDLDRLSKDDKQILIQEVLNFEKKLKNTNLLNNSLKDLQSLSSDFNNIMFNKQEPKNDTEKQKNSSTKKQRQ